MIRILKKALGVVLIIIGFVALITPLTPGSWLILIGLELLGLRLLLEGRLRSHIHSHPNGWAHRLFGRLLMRRKQPTDPKN